MGVRKEYSLLWKLLEYEIWNISYECEIWNMKYGIREP